jgi:hypoxanthine phosphoribosyltransferase
MSLDLATALQRSTVLYDRERLDREIRRLAAELDAHYAGGGQRPLLLTVMHGGLPFAGQLALAMRTDLEFDYVHATRYRGQTTGAELVWLHRPATPLRGRRVLLADDILDEGNTLREVRQWCLDEGASEVRVAVLAVKEHDRRVPGIAADHVGVTVPDRYVYGYGMDVYGQGRNLPAIYAMED